MRTATDLRRFRTESAAAGVVAAWFLAALSGRFGGSLSTAVVATVGGLAAPILAAIGCLAAARRSAGRLRASWVLLGAAALSWSLGKATWVGFELTLDVAPRPSVADVGYLLAVPFALAALLVLPTGRSGLAARVRSGLDGLTVALSLLFVSWVAVLGALYAHAPGDHLARVVGLTYPVGDVALCTVALLALVRVRGQDGLSTVTLGLLGGGLVALAVADSGFAYLTLRGEYATGNPLDAGWVVGWLLVLLAARAPAQLPTGTPGEDDRARTDWVGVVAPYVALCIALGLGGLVQLRRGRLDGFLVWDTLALLALGLVRQVLIVRENHQLTRDLEHRVEVRTVELRRSEDRFRSLVQNSSDVVTVVDAEGIVRYQSPTIAAMLGRAPEHAIGEKVTPMLHPADRQRFLAVLRDAQLAPGVTTSVELKAGHVDGRWLTVETLITSLLHQPSVQGVVLNMRDVTERRQLERRLSHDALHDRLTGVANRYLFADRVQQVVDSRSRRPRLVAIVVVDLDGFEALNDRHGMAVGDAYLADLGVRLRAVVRAGDTVARLGGDEFGVLCDDVESDSALVAVVERVLAAVQQQVEVDGVRVAVSGTAGYAVAEDCETPDELTRNAQLAMERAKVSRPGGWLGYESTMRAALERRVRDTTDLRRGLEAGEFVVHYQPTVDLLSGRIVGVEALVRWQHPERGLVPPLDFIPLAEESGLILELGQWVLEEACLQGAAWLREYGDEAPATMSVNLSGRQLVEADLLHRVARALERSELPPSRLCLEITESLLVEDTPAMLAALESLRAIGVSLAIDDFGTGYSSLSYLHRLPVDVLKVDRSFIALLGAEESEKRELACTIVKLGRGIGLETVAEGIETEVELLALLQSGCRLGQGFYFAHPVPASELEKVLATHAVLGPSGPVRVRPVA